MYHLVSDRDRVQVTFFGKQLNRDPAVQVIVLFSTVNGQNVAGKAVLVQRYEHLR